MRPDFDRSYVRMLCARGSRVVPWNKSMKATAYERNTGVPRADLYHAPQDPHGGGTGLRFETGEHGGDYPDNMPQAITVTDAQRRWAVYVQLRVGGNIVVPERVG